MKETHYRIAIIDPVGAKAGMDQYNNVLAAGIIKNGSEAVIFSNYGYTLGPLESHHTIHNRDKRKLSSLLSSITGVVRSLKAANRWGAEYVLLHVFRGGMVDLIYFVLTRIAGFRIIALVHDVESLESYSLPFFRRLVIEKLARIRLVHNAYSQQQLMKIVGNGGSARISIIPHVHFLELYAQSATLDVESALPQELKRADSTECIKLLFFGQIKRSKGLDLMLEAMNNLPGHIQLVIAGKIRDAEPDELLRQIEKSGIQSRVQVVLRHISDQERDALFGYCNILILPYRRIYQSGVLLMGMSAGIPVIASDLEPNKDAVIHGKTGLLFECGSSVDLITQIKTLAADASLRKTMSEQAKNHIRMQYDPELAGRLLIEAIQSA